MTQIVFSALLPLGRTRAVRLADKQFVEQQLYAMT